MPEIDFRVLPILSSTYFLQSSIGVNMPDEEVIQDQLPPSRIVLQDRAQRLLEQPDPSKNRREVDEQDGPSDAEDLGLVHGCRVQD